ncbi:peptidoglycan synthetase [Proteus mirabilis]|uniref:Peptidoglycan synthetase n=1 Tax=Proteus mirabilis TaxID=584 RepID=A0A379GDV1_PROMI|nr:peptidoglycan synthetase [Proteus mirabilis]
MMPMPKGVVAVQIDRNTGKLAGDGPSMKEYFIEGTQPTEKAKVKWVHGSLRIMANLTSYFD